MLKKKPHNYKFSTSLLFTRTNMVIIHIKKYHNKKNTSNVRRNALISLLAGCHRTVMGGSINIGAFNREISFSMSRRQMSEAFKFTVFLHEKHVCLWA